MDVNNQISVYFRMGMQQKEILGLLSSQHGTVISARTLKNVLRKAGLYRRKYYSDVVDVAGFVLSELQGSAKMLGYRMMHLKCIQQGFVVKRETVRQLLSILDPVGVASRKARRLRRRQYNNPGPNFLWHVDGYDKLKPYGLCISGCVDGYSRSVIWLKVYSTNNNPRVIASHFIEAVKTRSGSSRKIRFDRGTENVVVQQMQIFLTKDDTSVLFGSSNHNQRIESFWGILRKLNVQFWMNLFENLKDDNTFSGDFLDCALVQFCFMHLLQEELDTLSAMWNSHRIRKQRNQNAPSGCPAILYGAPHLYGAEEHLVHCSEEDIQNCEEECYDCSYPCDITVFELCCILMEENDLHAPKTVVEGRELYLKLRGEILYRLHN